MNENERILIPSSISSVKGRLSGWFTWTDLIVIIPLSFILFLPLLFGAKLSIGSWIGYLVADVFAFLVGLLLIYPLWPGRKKGYYFLSKLILHSVGVKKYEVSDESSNLPFPFTSIQNDQLIGPKTKASVLRLKGKDISIFGEDQQTYEINNFESLFHELSSPVHLIKFRRRQDYENWAQDLSKALNQEIRLFVEKNRKSLKDYKKQTDLINANKKTWGEYFEEVKSKLPSVQVSQLEAKLSNQAVNLDYIEHINNGDYFEPIYFILIMNSDATVLESETELAMSILNSNAPRRLTSKELPSFVSSYYVRNNIKLSQAEDGLLNALPTNVRFYRSHYKLNTNIGGIEKERYCKVVSVSVFPTWVDRFWLGSLINSFPHSFIIKTEDFPLDQAAEILNKKIRTAEVNALNVRDDIGKNESIKEVETLKATLESVQNGDPLQRVNMFILFNANSKYELLQEVRSFRKKIRSQGGYVIDNLPFQQKDGYVGMLPTRNNIFDRKLFHTIPTYAVAEGYPMMSDKFQDKGAPVLGVTNLGVPVMVDFKARTGMRTTSNTIIFGKSGKGKSFFSKKVIKDLVSNGVSTMIIDPEDEYTPITKAFNGIVIDFGAKAKNFINPLQYFPFDADGEDGDDYEMHISQAASFLRQAASLDEEEASIVPQLLHNLYKSFKITPKNAANIENNKWPLLQDLVNSVHLHAKKQTKDNSWGAKTWQKIYLKLGRVLDNPLKAKLWNNHTNVTLEESPITTFLVKDLLDISDKSIQNTQFQIIYNFVSQEISHNKQRYYKPLEELSMKISDIDEQLMTSKLTKAKKEQFEAQKKEMMQELDIAQRTWDTKWVALMVDEAHLMFSEENKDGAKMLHEKAKRVRKYHGMIILTTQNIGDFTDDPAILKQTKGIINNCQYIFSFGLASSDVEDLNNLLKEAGGLSTPERMLLANVERGSCLAIMGEGQRIQLTVDVSPEEHRIIDGGVM